MIAILNATVTTLNCPNAFILFSLCQLDEGVCGVVEHMFELSDLIES